MDLVTQSTPAGPLLIDAVYPQPLIQEHLCYYTQLVLLKEFKATKDYLTWFFLQKIGKRS